MIIKYKNKKKILPIARRDISENRINVKLMSKDVNQPKGNCKQVDVAIIISDKVDLNTQLVKRDEEDH